MHSRFLQRLGLANAWAQEAIVVLGLLAVGFALMPLLIFLAGSALLGRYDGAGAARLYDSVYEGLGTGSAASLAVVLGPCALYLGFRALLVWWRASAKLA